MIKTITLLLTVCCSTVAYAECPELVFDQEPDFQIVMTKETVSGFGTPPGPFVIFTQDNRTCKVYREELPMDIVIERYDADDFMENGCVDSPDPECVPDF